MRQRKKDAIRLNKLISEAGFCSRREADEYILQERVTVNSHIALPGDKVYKTDFIKIDGEPLRFVEKIVFEKKKPEFESKRITRRLGIKPKKKKETPTSEESNIDLDSNSKKGSNESQKPIKISDSKIEHAKRKKTDLSSGENKIVKKTGEAKKWFSGRKKR